jgi:hypothetical protein
MAVVLLLLHIQARQRLPKKSKKKIGKKEF